MSYRKIQLASIYFTCTLALILLCYFDPASPNTLYPPSLSREWGGFYCAGCGMFRALHQLLNGNLHAALKLNPLLITSLPYFFYLLLPYQLKYFHQIHLYTIRHKNRHILSIAIISLIYTILRNTSIPALSWLIPPS